VVFEEMVRRHPVVVTVEEGQLTNGFGAFMAREINALDLVSPPKVRSIGIPDEFVEHGARGVLLEKIGLDVDSIAGQIRRSVGDGARVESA
jgi:1-deoxy-D-xylulose-5-phosphate synthase